jgi:hypothetical protein
VDYANTRLKGTLLAKLEAGDLWQAHPSSPASLDELIMEAGISKSEKSDLLAWERVIYPYLERELDLKPWQVWQMLNKTKRRRLTPYLREIIDPDHETTSDKVKGTIEKLRDEADDVPDKDLAVVERLLEIAKSMTSRDMEEEISTEPTPAIEMDGTRHKIVTIDGETGEIVEERVMFKLVAWVTQDQLNLLRRRFPDRLSLMLQEGDDIRNTASGKKP